MLSAILAAEQASIFEPLITSGPVRRTGRLSADRRPEGGLEMPAKDYLKAMRIRRLMQEEFSRLFAEVDVLVTPGQLRPRRRVDQPLDASARGRPPAPGTPPPPAGLRGHRSGRQPGGTARAGAALRIRRQSAAGAAGGGRAILGEYSAGGRDASFRRAPTGTSAVRLWDEGSEGFRAADRDERSRQRCSPEQNASRINPRCIARKAEAVGVGSAGGSPGDPSGRVPRHAGSLSQAARFDSRCR